MYYCVDKLKNAEPCDHSNQCQSEMCSSYVSKQNVCYSCIADIKEGSPTFGKELTSHCDEASEFCDMRTLSCKPKVKDTQSCNDSGYECVTGKCDPFLRQCVQCETNSDCNKNYECQANTCKFVKFDDGYACTGSTQCSSGFCQEKFCQGSKADGTQCHSKYECDSEVCEYNTCGGPDFHNTTDPDNFEPVVAPAPEPVVEKPVVVPPAPAEEVPTKESNSSTETVVIICAVTILLVALIALFFCRQRKNRNSQSYDNLPSSSTPSVAQSKTTVQ